MSKGKVLIVEDQELVSTNIKLLLKFNDFEVVGEAKTAKEAFEILDKGKADIAVMDIALPGEYDGIESAKIIQEKYDLPVIYLTALKDDETLAKAKASQSYGFLIKDIDLKEQLPLAIEFAIYKFKTEKEKREIQKELEKSEKIFRTLFEEARDCLAMIDEKGVVEMWNKASESLFGFSRKEIIGENLFDFISPPKTSNLYQTAFSRFVQTGERKLHNVEGLYEIETRNKKGDTIYIEASLSIIELYSEKKALFIARDITERKKNEEEIEKLIQDLRYSRELIEEQANKTAMYSAALEKSQEKLKEANRSKDRFFSILAHDLKGPFQGLLGYADIIKRDADALSKDEIKDFASELYDSAKRLFRMLENLLEWSRLQRGTIKIEPSKINVKQSADMTIEFLQGFARQKGVTIENLAPDDLFIYADPNMFSTVVRNLVSNAIKFTKNGDKITVNARKLNDDFAEISVADTGVGIKKEDQEKLFRIDVKHSTKGTNNEEGTGLGLILCKEFVEKNGGEIWVESELGKGSTFSFSLPLYKENVGENKTKNENDENS